MSRIKIGISSCLLGNKVRYDGQHKLDHFITDTLSQWCEFVPVCPEVECGLPIPRESMRLTGDPENPRLTTGKTGIDHTPRMNAWMKIRLEELAGENLVAFIFKTKSPSSGLRNVKVYSPEGPPASLHGQGLFAAGFTRRFPDIPVEDEGRLCDPVLRENFIETIFVLQRWRETVRTGGPGDLTEFHTRHKYTFMAHSPALLREMGKLVAAGGSGDFTAVREQYRGLLLKTLALTKTPKKNHNVLLHMLGYFKRQLTADEKQELLFEAETYRTGGVPLIVPLTLVRHYTRKYGEKYLARQYFLHPHPVELGLLNHV
jgi:uncharacterized protein YbgA (DUF1722 family)/uncharacterized protein YbbK (DUF523 family)